MLRPAALVAMLGIACLGVGLSAHAAERVGPGDGSQQNNQPRADQILNKAAKQVPGLERLANEIRGAEDHDRATAALGMDARLANFNLMTRVTTSLGPAIHIPIQISKREGGRQSLYFIKTGEQVIAGVYIIGDELYYRAVRRDSGKGSPAATGDLFTESILAPDGAVISEQQGRIQLLDWDKGIGVLEPVSGAGLMAADTSVWILWSCVKVDTAN